VAEGLREWVHPRLPIAEGKGCPHGWIGPAGCRYPPRDTARPIQPLHSGGVGHRARGKNPERAVSALPSGEPGAQILVPHWLDGDDRELLARVVRAALAGTEVHPVAGIHLEDVLSELHVAAARDLVWPASAARVRLATGWDDDVLPVRLSAAELASLLSLTNLPDGLRARLLNGSSR